MTRGATPVSAKPMKPLVTTAPVVTRGQPQGETMASNPATKLTLFVVLGTAFGVLCIILGRQQRKLRPPGGWGARDRGRADLDRAGDRSPKVRKVTWTHMSFLSGPAAEGFRALAPARSTVPGPCAASQPGSPLRAGQLRSRCAPVSREHLPCLSHCRPSGRAPVAVIRPAGSSGRLPPRRLPTATGPGR